jgi:autophagy-related protein 2
MAWWQKRLLRYALSRTGLLDDSALDPEKLDIALGKKNVIELKDVGLNIKRISKLAQLPSGLRIETARVLSLRLTVPADIYQSSIVAEVDGVELSLRLEEDENVSPIGENKARARSPATARSPQHRKAHRRLPSPPPYDPGGLSDSDSVYIPTTEELAKSFLQEEPAQERRELEASVAAGSKGLEESVASETSDDFGTGATIGLPGFLAGFLQGVVDRLEVKVKNVEANVHVELPGDGERNVPVTLRLHVGETELRKVGLDDNGAGGDDNTSGGRRKVNLSNISLDLLSDADVFSELSELPSRDSPSQSRQQETHWPSVASSVLHSTSPTMGRSQGSATVSGNSNSSPKSVDAMRASILTADSDRFADAGEEDKIPPLESSQAELDIQPGDDNISWGSRRSKSSAPSEDLWKSMVSEDDLPESLLLERASTPRARSSRGHSPNVTRAHRDQSPLSKALQSPGSWPRIDESPPRHSYPQSPGSWPLEQSRQSMFQSMIADPPLRFEDATDNKRAALEASAAIVADHDVSPEPQTPEVEDLTVSKVFSHEEAESMYMSAMTHTLRMHVPGGWSEDSPSERSLSSPGEVTDAHPQPTVNSTSADQAVDDDLAYGERPYSTPDAPRSAPSTPRPQSPIPLPTALHDNEKKRASKQLLHIASVSVSFPARHSSSSEIEPPRSARTTSASASFHPQGMPGTFSAYSELTASRHHAVSFSMPSESVSWAKREKVEEIGPEEPVSIEIAMITCQLDIPSGRLLYLLTTKALLIIQGTDGDEANASPPSTQRQSKSVAVDVSIKQLSLALKDSIDASTGLGKSCEMKLDGTVTIQCQAIDISTAPGEKAIRVGSFRIFLGPGCFLAFDRSRDIKTSSIITDQTPDIALVIANKLGVNRRPTTEISLETLPIAVLVDLPIIEETFSSFGGLSGVLEIGNSILSESGIGSLESSPLKPSKGVRFEGDPQFITDEPELKINARFGGIVATLHGSAFNVKLQTSTVKTVYRRAGAVATIEHVRLAGPNVSEGKSEAATIELTTLRLEYLFSPQDRDLERLLSLLTPSKDKYDNDDDILIDTLLRQRRKGAVARVSVKSVKLVCHDLSSLSSLSTFGDELGKLSAVAKYLPDDERPGLLSLLRVKEIEARIPVNESFGAIHVNSADLHCAHVGLPALLALSIGNIKASQSGEQVLLHTLVPLTGSENLPMVMARMLGDEVEPTVKVKLFNVCVEYSVALVLALTGIDEAQTHDIVAELARSVADMASPSSPSNEKTVVSVTTSSSAPGKKLNVELLIHDSAIGLTPHKLPSKALLVLSDTSLSSKAPPEQSLQALADIRKAGLFVADQIDDAEDEGRPKLRCAPGNSTTKAKLTSALSNQGFVSVGSIMAAKISVKIDESPLLGSKSIDVDVRNELLLLETSADSTQTLIAILNGLAPPTAPSKQPQYLTEPMTIEDMVASFSGDAFPKPEKPPETLFDVEEEPEDDPDMMFDAPLLDEDDDGLLAESTMTSSLYGPIGRIMDGGDEREDDDTEGPVPSTVESFLEEEDPFEMTTAPTDAPLNDAALVRELNKQCKPAASEAVDLGNYEVEDLGFDALGGNTNVLGAKYRFNTPATRRVNAPDRNLGVDLPFKLKLRDLHIIWNIYDGFDWQRTRDCIAQAVEQVETRAEQRQTKTRQSHNDEDDEESVIGDFLFNSIYIGVPSNHDVQELRRQINRNIDDLASETESVPMSGISRPTTFSTSGRPIKQRPLKRLKLERSRAHKVAFELKGVSADIVVCSPDSTDVVSSVDLRVKDFEIFDNVPTSTWRKFLTQLDDPGSRELSKPMMHIELLNVRTLENFAASEIVLHVSVLPLRLHVDQDALDFITRFFEFKDASMTPASKGSDQPFLQRVEVDTVDMCLDYKPKKVDYAGLRSGHTTEFMNFVILDAANIRLKHAIVYGIKGFEPLHKTLNDVWMPDIKRNQLPTILAGLAPVRSLVNIGTGMRDVVAIPIREYQKDGRIVRSIQKGAFHFGKTTTSELARLGAKVALGTQTLLSGAEGFLTPSSSSPSGRPSVGRRRSSEQGWQDVGSEDEERETRALSAYANQPLGVFAGLRSARAHLEHDLLTARDALIAVQGEILESSSAGGAAAAVVKHAPTVILRPIIGTSRAVGTALLGVGNQIDQGHLRKVEDVSCFDFEHLRWKPC